ncbi:hypothetical protein KM043_001557 [Ampulex compressa]|nr:hypothetical protein KM043_001557 [Ampulex compressa]
MVARTWRRSSATRALLAEVQDTRIHESSLRKDRKLNVGGMQIQKLSALSAQVPSAEVKDSQRFADAYRNESNAEKRAFRPTSKLSQDRSRVLLVRLAIVWLPSQAKRGSTKLDVYQMIENRSEHSACIKWQRCRGNYRALHYERYFRPPKTVH